MSKPLENIEIQPFSSYIRCRLDSIPVGGEQGSQGKKWPTRALASHANFKVEPLSQNGQRAGAWVRVGGQGVKISTLVKSESRVARVRSHLAIGSRVQWCRTRVMARRIDDKAVLPSASGRRPGIDLSFHISRAITQYTTNKSHEFSCPRRHAELGRLVVLTAITDYRNVTVGN